MNDFYAELLTKERVQTFHRQADQYRQLKNALPANPRRVSSIFVLWQQVWQRLKRSQGQNPQARG